SVTCNDWREFVSALAVFGRAAIVATLIGRAYAVCSRNRLILAYLMVLGTMCVVADAVRLPINFIACSESLIAVYLLRSLFTIAFETSVAVITTVRTVQALRAGGPWKSQKYRLFYLMFEEGKVLTIVSLCHLIQALTGILYFWYAVSTTATLN
ncbi:hypothetical protein GYMLUDRAFT_165318, partial [Collybiopsis luxurians FD-317 M1]